MRVVALIPVYLAFITALFSSASMSAATDVDGEVAYEPRFRITVRVESGFRHGYINQTGEVVIEPVFGEARYFSEGLAAVSFETHPDDVWGIIDRNGEMIIEPQFDSAGDFHEGLAKVRVGESPGVLWGYIDRTGSFVLEPQFKSAGDFSEGLAEVVLDGVNVFINRDGETVLVVHMGRLNYLRRFVDGIVPFRAFREEPYSKFGYIDMTGSIVIEAQFTAIGLFSDGLAMAAIGYPKRYGYIDRTGAWVILPQFERGGDFSEGVVVVAVGSDSDTDWLFIDATGSPAFEAKFEFADSFSEGLAAVQQGDLVGFIDHDGVFVIEPQYAGAGRFDNGLAFVWTGLNSEGPYVSAYIDTHGTIVWSTVIIPPNWEPDS